MRPPLTGWQQGDYLVRARKTTPIEAARMASLPDEYVEAIKAVNDSDEFAFTCINMGVPLGIATAINTEIVRVLDECKVMKATPEQVTYVRQCSTPGTQVYDEDSHTCNGADLTNQVDMEATETHLNAMQNDSHTGGLQGITAAIKSAIVAYRSTRAPMLAW